MTTFMTDPPIITGERVRQERAALVAMTERLIAEYNWVPAGRVMVTVAGCRSELLRMGLRGEGLLLSAEAMARTRMGLFSREEVLPV